MVLLTQYSISHHPVSREIYQNMLCSAVWVISNSLAVSGGVLCLGHGWHRHFMAYSAFKGCLSGGCDCLKSLKPGEKSWERGCSDKLNSPDKLSATLCRVELLLEIVLKLLGNSRKS